MLFRDLAAHTSGRLIGDGNVDITSIEYDSRSARPGSLFVAVPGFKVDGHVYLGRALEQGVEAVAVQADHEGHWRAIVEEGGADVLVLEDTRAGLARLAAAFHGFPARKLGVIGVTGTDGKTSLCHLVAHVLNSSGHKAGLISTAECRIGDQLLPDTGRFTTPEAPQVQEMLAEMVAGGCEWAVIEATSHGLVLHRVDECEYDIAALTNIGADHLDFHGSQEDYVSAKSRLFQMLDESIGKGIAKTAALNADDPANSRFRSLSRAKVLSYGLHKADVAAESVTHHATSIGFYLTTPAGSREVLFPKPGLFNVYNALGATAIGIAAGLSIDEIVPALEAWPGAPGRMQFIHEGQPFTVLVDFAHAPDSLRRVLHLLREIATGRIIAVFGCIGEHDRERRPGMARAAAELADYTFITDDNPYSEDRDAILKDIADAMRAAGKREGHDFSVVPDRREAIAQALAMAVDEDAVLLAGKGHEREVHLRDGDYPCDDREVSRAVLRELGYRTGA
ncbi:MAG TPA: UDP-N-acetylmuramoyl-L-alanyl-D-glutamate--2,6-diaminopimelate ligase [Dehalococcoidia bacterium]|nr:UDP-N-acetylmuramoyl-L-alanyl-D-glutamate--2,6-diaminopimelate ligase [Dehalococcoidia bacterium]